MMAMDTRRKKEQARRVDRWPRYVDGDPVMPGDVIDVQHLGRMRVLSISCGTAAAWYVNGFCLSGLDIRKGER